MFSCKSIILVAILINGCYSEAELDLPCKLNDNACAVKVLQKAADLVFTGSPSLGLPSIDPLFFDFVEGNLTIVNYKLYNSTLSGYKGCRFQDISADLPASKMNMDLVCSGNTQMTGKFDLSGRVYSGIIAGKGDYDFTQGPFKVALDVYFARVPTTDGKTYLKVKSFLARATVRTPFKAAYKNLVSRDIAQFSQDNWNAVGDLLQEPLMFASLKKIFGGYINLYLKTKPFEN